MTSSAPPALVLLFTGHRIDAPDRPEARFPPTPEAEAAARQMIEDAVRAACHSVQAPVMALAGAASGGDILFHEVCTDLGVQSRILLPMPPEPFRAESVSPAGAAWDRRFDALCESRRPDVLSAGEAAQVRATLPTDASVWEVANAWMLRRAAALGAREVVLIALWDLGDPDGRGGTADLVRQARQRGFRCVRLAAETLRRTR